jgi:hypothetical protein
MKNPLFVVATVIALLGATTANAMFIDRGGGMIYDTEQNITWLQDMSFAQASGYPIDRAHQYQEALGWAESLDFGGYTDWRLPSAGLLNDYNLVLPGESSSEWADRMQALHNLRSFDGSTDYGYNNTRSELGHLFAELGNLALYDSVGNVQGGAGLTNSGPFTNIKNGRYYEDVRFLSYFGEYYAWGFDFSTGQQNQASAYLLPQGSFVTAVRDGDVASVPEPSSLLLMSMGILLLVWSRRRAYR